MTPEVLTYLTNLGMPGLVILALLYVYRQQTSELRDLRAAFNAMQEKRIEESRESIRALEANTSATVTQSRLIEQSVQMITAGRR